LNATAIFRFNLLANGNFFSERQQLHNVGLCRVKGNSAST
jgi:hypothetical protein